MPDRRQLTADSCQPQSRGSVRFAARLTVWSVSLLALAMVAALASEAVRAAVREQVQAPWGALFLLPPLVGFALAAVTIRALSTQGSVGPRACPGLNGLKLS